MKNNFLHSKDPAVEKAVRLIVNTSVAEGADAARRMPDCNHTLKCLNVALESERSGLNRTTLIKAIEAKLKKQTPSKYHSPNA